jgi:enamine deaminase RidA (YjgF/YER057c/UK114 family)
MSPRECRSTSIFTQIGERFRRNFVCSETQEHKMIERPPTKGLLHTATFAQVLVATGARTVYTSGQVSIDEQGKLIGAGDLAAQTTQAMKNLGLALEAAGATFADIVKTTTFVVNYRPELRTVITDAKKPFWAGKPPTSALIGVSALAVPEWLIEIEAVAVLDI